jgi:excinuclease ABC subunit C
LQDIDGLFQRLIFSYYQNSFSLPNKIILNIKPSNLKLIQQAIQLKFEKKILVSTTITSGIRKVSKLGTLNANQVIDNRVNQSQRYSFAIKDLASHLGIDSKELTIEGFDVSHHSGKNAVGSCVRFSSKGPDKSGYRLFNISENYSGNDIGSIQHILERRINGSKKNPLSKIILIDGGELQLKIALEVFSNKIANSPIILSIVKGSKRVRAAETILSKNGVLEMPIKSPGFILLQQIRDESHRFAITSNRKKKSKNIKYSALNNIEGLGPVKKKALLKNFNSLKAIKNASVDNLCSIEGISIKLAREIKNNL